MLTTTHSRSPGRSLGGSSLDAALLLISARGHNPNTDPANTYIRCAKIDIHLDPSWQTRSMPGSWPSSQRRPDSLLGRPASELRESRRDAPEEPESTWGNVMWGSKDITLKCMVHGPDRTALSLRLVLLLWGPWGTRFARFGRKDKPSPRPSS